MSDEKQADEVVTDVTPEQWQQAKAQRDEILRKATERNSGG